MLSNSEIAELLALAGEEAKMPLQKALRRASRKAFLWPDEVADLVQQGRSLTELPGIGPHLSRVIHDWIEAPPSSSKPPAIRREFLTLTEARAALANRPSWVIRLKGDLQTALKFIILH